MKKLLSILGTITIAGSGMAGLVGNAPAKNNINYQQTNNLETLKRNKRSKITVTNKEDGLNRMINNIENDYCFLCHNRLILQIDKVELNDIIFFKDTHPNSRDALFNKIFKTINQFKKENNSGDNNNSDYISDRDLTIITNVFVDNFEEIRKTFEKDVNKGLIIRTNRDSYWSSNDDWWGVHSE